MKRIGSFLAAILGSQLMLATPALAAEFSGEGQVAGSKVVVRDLKRDAAATVTLRFQLVNEGEQNFKTYGLLGDSYAMDKVSLIDVANKKKYLVVEDSEGVCICSEFKGEVEPGGAINLWAKYPAPPGAVKLITVLVPGFEPVESVPIVAALPDQ
jgi:hypothetical protein